MDGLVVVRTIIIAPDQHSCHEGVQHPQARQENRGLVNVVVTYRDVCLGYLSILRSVNGQ